MKIMINHQDCIGTKDIEKAVGEVFGVKYESFFNDPGSDKSKNDNYDDQDDIKSRSITGIAWNKESFIMLIDHNIMVHEL